MGHALGGFPFQGSVLAFLGDVGSVSMTQRSGCNGLAGHSLPGDGTEGATVQRHPHAGGCQNSGPFLGTPKY